MLCTVHSRRVPMESQLPVVSFCFDDFPRTALSAGGSILRAFGAHGTYYAALGLINSSNELGDQLRTADIDNLLSDGHELGSHTFSHSSCRSIPGTEFEKDVLRGRDAIQALTGCDASDFAFPYGHVTLESKKRLGRQMNSCRGIYSGINESPIDLNLLRANSLYGDVDQFARAESLLAENEKLGGWLIFYTHDVRREPSPFGCTPDLLDKIVARTVEKRFRIAPVGETVRQAARSMNPLSMQNTSHWP